MDCCFSWKWGPCAFFPYYINQRRGIIITIKPWWACFHCIPPEVVLFHVPWHRSQFQLQVQIKLTGWGWRKRAGKKKMYVCSVLSFCLSFLVGLLISMTTGICSTADKKNWAGEKTVWEGVMAWNMSRVDISCWRDTTRTSHIWQPDFGIKRLKLIPFSMTRKTINSLEALISVMTSNASPMLRHFW